MSWEDLMSEIHGRLPDGTWVRGVEVFRRLYSAVGWGAVVSLSRLPLIRGMLDFGYRVFARNRLRLTGRCTPCEKSCRLDNRQAPKSTLGRSARTYRIAGAERAAAAAAGNGSAGSRVPAERALPKWQ
jgi:hypothetical protein